MTKTLLLVFLMLGLSLYQQPKRIIARQGQVSFFSYTSVENIKAENNQVRSIIDLEDGKIAVSMLMNTFVFEKALMKEHFNESYIESDIYPKAIFEGIIVGFDAEMEGEQTRMIKGVFTMHGVSQEIEIKANIQNSNGKYSIEGSFETLVEYYNINIPALLAGNIAESISINFRFEYEPYEN